MIKNWSFYNGVLGGGLWGVGILDEKWGRGMYGKVFKKGKSSSLV